MAKIPMNEMDTIKMLGEKGIVYYTFDWDFHHKNPTLNLFMPPGDITVNLNDMRKEFLEKGWILRLWK